MTKEGSRIKHPKAVLIHTFSMVTTNIAPWEQKSPLSCNSEINYVIILYLEINLYLVLCASVRLYTVFVQLSALLLITLGKNLRLEL